MDSSEHSRDSSVDDVEHDMHYRDSDDMLARRLAGNMPAPLRKKKNDGNFKRFITPTGNPMVYVRQHARSRSMGDIAQEKAERDHERDERNLRYEEMERLKDMLKEEEVSWTSKLDNWKERRRSATIDVRRRKEDRDTATQQTSTSSWRKPKTYKEIVEEKRRREAGLLSFDDEDSSAPFEQNKLAEKKTKSRKQPYRGAISEPSFAHLNGNRSTSKSPPSSNTRVVVQPIRYTSKVTAVINHVPSGSGGSTDTSRDELSPRSDTKTSVKEPTNPRRPLTKLWPPPSTEVPKQAMQNNYAPPTKASESVSASRSKPTYAEYSKPRSYSPPPSSYPSKASVVMRQKSPNTTKERPKSAYGSVGSDRASTLPRNYHSYNAPKPFDANASSFVQKRKNAFASKRNMWENMALPKDEPTRSAHPQHLASLLKQDTDKLQGHGPSNVNNSWHIGVDAMRDNEDEASPTHSMPEERDLNAHEWQSDVVSSRQTEHKPKIFGNSSITNNSAPWLRDFSQTQTDSQSSYKRGNEPVSRSSWSKSATLPSKNRHLPVEERTIRTKSHAEDTAMINGSRLIERTTTDQQPSPTSSSGAELFDDMKICINQRPKSEKGFGFTVRGGDDGRPVIVNTVSPGGAADVCQLCVGDEILAINDVRLDASLTQGGIVQLIVDSVITGNLALDIRRYGKSKKSNPLRLSGTKVVMTSGGFVQVRSDKGKPPEVSTKHFNGFFTNAINKREDYPVNNDVVSPHELPLPPPPENLEPPKRLSAVERLSPKKTSPSAYRRSSPLSNLVDAAKSTSPPPQGRDKQPRTDSTDRVHAYSPNSYEEYEDDLQLEVMKAQHEIDVEERYLTEEKRQHEENLNLRKQLLEEQRLLEEREAKREEEKRRRIEEARAEEQKVEEELKRIEAAKLEQQRRREEEKRRLLEGSRGFNPTYMQGETNHWLIEEAERSRLAEDEGRRRINAFDYGREKNPGNALPDHVIQRLSQRNQPQRGNPHIPGTLKEYWNDPSTPATLL